MYGYMLLFYAKTTKYLLIKLNSNISIGKAKTQIEY